MNEALLRRMAEDVRAGGPCLAVGLRPFATTSSTLVRSYGVQGGVQ
jgi:hypothetical protein